jgi:transcriptional regulator GlxA family with amidase domain
LISVALARDGEARGVAMSLHLVERFAGRELAVKTAKQIEYKWDPVAGGGA